MMRVPRIACVLLVATLILMFSACSTLTLIYPRLDWIVLYYVRGHVTLTDDQSDRLEAALAATQRWHCATQLEDYARWLRALNTDIQSGRTDYAVVAARYAELLRYWGRVADYTSGELAALVPLLTDAQVDEYAKNLLRDNARLREEIVDPPLAKRQQRGHDLMQTNLERWIGDLTPLQQQALDTWSAAQAANAGEARLGARVVWQQELLRVLALRGGDAGALRVGLLRLLTEPQSLWSADYAHYRTARREQTLRLIESIASTLTDEQRRHFANRALGWARDFEQLACPATRRG